MKLRDLLIEVLNQFTHDEIINRLIELYPAMGDSKEAYYNVVSQLQYIDPIEDEKGMKLDISHVHNVWEDLDLDDDIYEHVSGVTPDGEHWAIEYTPWEKWLGYEITQETLKYYSKLDILVHSMWEMTFAGFDQETIKNKIDALNKSIDDIKEDIANGGTGGMKFNNVDDFMNYIDSLPDEDDDE